MHALITTDAVGGVWTYAVDLCAELDRSGVRCLLACIGPAPKDDQRSEAESVAELVCLADPLDWLAATRADVAKTADKVAALAARAQVDIVHCNTPAYAALADFPCSVLAMTHSCLATWWRAVRGAEPMPADFRWRAQLHRDGLLAASRMCAPTSAFALATRDAYNLPASPTVVQNGRREPESVQVAPRDIQVFAAGRLWDEGKGYGTLDRVAARLTCPVHIAGPASGPNGASIQFQHATHVGELTADQIAAALSGSPVFVSAAIYEPFGLTPLEAAQRGCALVLSDIPVFRELWDGAAAFVAPDDEAGLATAVESYLAEPDLRMRAGQRALERSAAYSASAMAAATLELYEATLREPLARLADVA